MNEEILKLVLELGDNAGTAVYILMAVNFLGILITSGLIAGALYGMYKLAKQYLDDKEKDKIHYEFYLSLREHFSRKKSIHFSQWPGREDLIKMLDLIRDKIK